MFMTDAHMLRAARGPLLAVCVGVFGAAMLVGGRAHADAGSFASQWQETPYSRARLIVAGPRDGAGETDIGVQIELSPGWKTYWRVPGESGVPPVFDFSGSSNLANSQIRWPAPKRFRDQYGEAIGYKNEVVFPVAVRAERPGEPVSVHLNLVYAVCREICLPAEASFKIMAPASFTMSSPHAAKVSQFQNTVPQEPGPDTALKVSKVKVEGEGARTRLMVKLEGEAKNVEPEFFVEGPPELYFHAGKRAGKQGQPVYSIAVDGLESGRSLAGERLRFTVIAGEKRLQQSWVLD